MTVDRCPLCGRLGRLFFLWAGLGLLLALSVNACGQTPPGKRKTDSSGPAAAPPPPPGSRSGQPAGAPPPSGRRVTVVLLPLGDFPADLLEAIREELPAALPVDVETGPSLDLPESARSTFRPSRYRADALLDLLAARPEAVRGKYVLGLTTKDISCTKGKFPDWGVFGLGLLDGRAAVVSTFRLSRNAGPAKLRFRVVSTARHETGHMLGLDHCTEPGCLMLDAQGSIRNTDTGSGRLGPGCRRQLIDRYGEW